jgi:hypothetical protein
LLSLLGDSAIKSAACGFQCGANLSVAGPANFAIYERKTKPDYQLAPILDYLQPPNPHRYSIRQYAYPNMQALKDKLLQFPVGSSFDLLGTFQRAIVMSWWKSATFCGTMVIVLHFSSRNVAEAATFEIPAEAICRRENSG